MWTELEQVSLLKGPDFQAVDVEVLLGGEWLVVEGGTFGGGAPVQLRVQPQTQLTTSSSHLQRINISLHKVRILPCPAVHLDLRTEAVEECLSCAVAVFTH